MFYRISGISTLTLAVQLGLRIRRSLRTRYSFTYHDLGQRAPQFVIHMFVQPQLPRAPIAAFTHPLIFWVFFSYIGTVLISLEHHTPLSFLHGLLYLLFSLVSDVYWIVLLAGVGIVTYRQYVLYPARSRTRDYEIQLLLFGAPSPAGFLVERSATGSSRPSLGEEGLFQQLVQSNVGPLNMCGLRTIVTTCSHYFNTLKNEHPQFGGDYAISHRSEPIASLLAQGQPVSLLRMRIAE